MKSVSHSVSILFIVVSLICLTFSNLGILPVQAATTLESQALTLGAPGLSYRYVQTFGAVGEPYLADTDHINRPHSLYIDSNDNIYVTEEVGKRVLKYDLTGNNLLALGQAGICETGNYTFCSPIDTAVDGEDSLWVADGSRVVEYDGSGVFIQELPVPDTGSPGDNTHFDSVGGVAFDATGQMYVSDTNNHRVQVYTFTDGSPVYNSTLGIMGESGSDNNHFDSPYRLAVDSNNKVYVLDRGNNRVQQCLFSGGWTCTTFESGLSGPQGITVDASDNVYIADTSNGRIRKCSSAGVCADFVVGTYAFYDLAIDSSGNVYGAATYEDIVVKYDNLGNPLGTFLGVEFVPYLTDDYHYLHPRVVIDDADNIIIVEENGHRLTKLDANGVAQWSFGVPGVDAWDNDHFNYPHAAATDSSGKIYVADNCRVQIISSAGAYLDTLGTGCGTGDYEFGWATGIAVDSNGNIYVADYSNHRVQIYNSSYIFIGRIGTTGVCGTANDHLCTPIAVDVDSNGNVYVTDGGNLRVQKFNSSYVWQMTIGDGTWGESFDQFAWPEDIAVDTQGRIFVSDWNNNRIQVFAADGAYLTTIAGSWGSNTSQLKGAAGVDVDSSGNVYVADWENARIQKFALGVPDWQQANINGFGNKYNSEVLSLETFNNQIYAGASNYTDGATIWRRLDNNAWTPATEPGFGSAYADTNAVIFDMFEFNGYLYAGTGKWWDDGVAGQIWRSIDGTTWELVEENGFGNSNNFGIAKFAIFNNYLYASTFNPNDGLEIWRSATGENDDWQNITTGAFGGGADYSTSTSLMTFNDQLYTAVEASNSVGAQIWRTTNGITWNKVSIDGFSDIDNHQTGGFAIFAGALYIGTRNDVTGAQLFRTTNGTTWTQVIGDGFGSTDNYKIESLYAFDGYLYAVTDNNVDGIEIWRTLDGVSWNQANLNGFGDSNNTGTLWSNATTVYNSQLYIGTSNGSNGGEIWALNDTLAPVVVSSVRANTSPTNAVTADFTITFSESVTGVNSNDFSLATTGGVTGASIGLVSGSGATRTVSVNTGSGNGTIRLDVPASATITDLAGNALSSLPYTDGETYTINKMVTLTINSTSTQDGWILESSETSKKGGTINASATTCRLGDDVAKKQYVCILSFNTGSLPDGANITAVTLKIRKQAIIGGGNPVTAFQGFMVDIKKGVFGTAALQASDFQTVASKSYGPFKPALVSNVYSINLIAAKNEINKLTTASGLTQIRLRFKLDDNNNAIANYLSFHSGNAGAASRPQLVIVYTVP